MKQCTKCKETKSISEFNKDTSHSKNGLHSHCKQCVKKYNQVHKVRRHEQQKKYYQLHKAKILKRNKEYSKTEKGKSANLRKRLKSNYGITLEQYDKMIEDQNGVCAICGGINTNGQRLCVDHDHKTGKVRKLLCHRCNSSLGWVREDITVLRLMVKYLDNEK
ncbi:endonuclease VII domain-containing protein [Candidatus Pacearchaeota archaeon]|nr:endonuclease VII domain-containing protein [Candidatus Pacearchaeota archaeon]